MAHFPLLPSPLAGFPLLPFVSPSTYLAPSSCERNRPPPSQVACKLTPFAPPFTQLTHPPQIPRTPPAPRLQWRPREYSGSCYPEQYCRGRQRYSRNVTALNVTVKSGISSGFEHKIIFISKKHGGDIIYLTFPDLSKFGLCMLTRTFSGLNHY